MEHLKEQKEAKSMRRQTGAGVFFFYNQTQSGVVSSPSMSHIHTPRLTTSMPPRRQIERFERKTKRTKIKKQP